MTRKAELELQRIRNMPYGTARTAAAEAVARRIDAEGPREQLAEALLDLVEAYTFNGEGAKSFVAFARLLRHWDESPQLFDAGDRRNLFWEYKWVARDLSDFPQITSPQANAFLLDMERRFELEGNGTSTVRMSRFLWSWFAGQPDMEQNRIAWVGGIRDMFEDCEACTVGNQTMYFTELGRYEEAVAVGLTQRSSCNKEPACTHHSTALAALMIGDPELALAQHKLALASTTEDNDSNESARAKCFEMLARGGRLAQALRILRNDDAALLRDAASPLLQLRFLLGILAGLSANLPEEARLETGLRDPQMRTVEELHAWARAECERLAARFDERNGTPFYTEQLARALAARPAERPLPDDSVVAPAAPAAAPVREDESGSAAQAAAIAADAPRSEREAVGASGDSGGSTSGEPDDESGDARFARAEGLLAVRRYRQAAPVYSEAAAAFEAEGWIERAGLAYAEAAQCAALSQDDESAHRLFGYALARLRSGGAATGALVAVLTAWAPVAARLSDARTQIEATAAMLDGLPEFEAQGVSEDLADRMRAEHLRQRAALRDTLARSIAASEPHHGSAHGSAHGADLGSDLSRERAIREASSAGEEFAALGLISDAAHAFWLAGKIQRETGDTDGAIWSLESAFEGFTVAREGEERARAASELIELLRETGQADRAEEITAQLLA